MKTLTAIQSLKAKKFLSSIIKASLFLVLPIILTSCGADYQPEYTGDSAVNTRTTGTENWREVGPTFYTFEQMCNGSAPIVGHEHTMIDDIKSQLRQDAIEKHNIHLFECSEFSDYLKTHLRVIDFTSVKMHTFRPLVFIAKELVDFQKSGGKTNFKGLFLSGESIDPAQTARLDIFDQLEGFLRLNLPKNDTDGQRADCPLRDKSKCV